VSDRALVELDRDECLALLAAGEVGRVVVAAPPGAPPIVRPVTYRFDDQSQSVVFRTDSGSKLHALSSSDSACFEVDQMDPGERLGWSVIVAGVTERVTSPGEIARLDRLGLRPWISGTHGHWIRIHARSVSGRRVAEIDGKR
jgi:uncharacterized protein